MSLDPRWKPAERQARARTRSSPVTTPLSPITPRRTGTAPTLMLQSASGGEPAQGRCPWRPFPQPWPSPKPQAAVHVQETGQPQGASTSPLLSREDVGVCPPTTAAGAPCVPGRQRGTVRCAAHPSPHIPVSCAPEDLPSVNMETPPSAEAGVHDRYPRRGHCLSGQLLVPSLITVWQEPKYEGHARTRSPRDGPFECPDKPPAAL